MNNNYFYKAYEPKDLVSLNCAVCGSNSSNKIADENNLEIIECGECQYTYVNPRPNSANLELFYREYFPPNEALADSWGAEMASIFDSIFHYSSSRLVGGNLLDIGCSYGHFLSRFQTNIWTLYGIDPSPTAIQYCNRLHPEINTCVGNFENSHYKQDSFDLITCFYVVEHVFDPRDFLNKIHLILRPGGMLIIRIPYSRPFFFISKLLRRPLMYAPMHLNDFSPNQFSRMILELGYSSVEVTIGATRSSSSIVELIGAKFFGLIGYMYSALINKNKVFPFAGAYTYIIRK